MKITKENFGTDSQGQNISAYTITNQSGASITVLDYGAILKNVCVPDRMGNLRDVVLGYDELASYEVNPPFFGATIGRNGNRIDGRGFKLNGSICCLARNENDRVNLHSGPMGFEKRFFAARPEKAAGRVTFSLLSPDGDQGFPGQLRVQVGYTFTEDNTIRITYDGIADQDTILNMTNHSYWNLDGAGHGLILQHCLQLEADAFTPIDDYMIPTGELRPVAGTPFDFRAGKSVAQDAQAEDEQLGHAGGSDHNFVLRGKGFRRAARLESKTSGIRLEVYTDQPGLQVYAGNFISGPAGKGGAEYLPHSGIALETQHFPDAVHQPGFASTVLPAGEKYHTVTEYRLGKK